MIERNNPSHDAQRLADGEIHHVRPHRNRSAFHLCDETGEKLHLGCGDHRVAGHFLDGIAAVGGINHREFVGVLAQNFRYPPQDLCALQRKYASPFVESGFCRSDSDINVVCTGLRDLAE
jgi:hypothetical protein